MMSAKVNGAKKMAALLDGLPKQIEDDIQRSVLKGANEIAAAQKTMVPVDTGALKDSIQVTGPGDRIPSHALSFGARRSGSTVGRLEAVVTAGNSDVRYAHLVEYGTQNTDAQPFFWPGFRNKRERVNRRIKRETSKAIKKASGL